jgi:hypothetical protein
MNATQTTQNAQTVSTDTPAHDWTEIRRVMEIQWAWAVAGTMDHHDSVTMTTTVSASEADEW